MNICFRFVCYVIVCCVWLLPVQAGGHRVLQCDQAAGQVVLPGLLGPPAGGGAPPGGPGAPLGPPRHPLRPPLPHSQEVLQHRHI